MDQRSDLKPLPTGNECLSIANVTPLPPSLQLSTNRGVMIVFFNHLHCRTSTMAQVATLVAKSLFNTVQLPLSNMKSFFWSCCNFLKQLSPPYACEAAKIAQPIMAGYELVMEKVWKWFRVSITDQLTKLNNHNALLWKWGKRIEPVQAWLLTSIGSWLLLISSSTVKEHKQV